MSELARATTTLHEYPELDEALMLGRPSWTPMASDPTAPLSSGAARTNQKSKKKEGNDALYATVNDLLSTALLGPSSPHSWTVNISQSDPIPLQSTAAELSPPPSSALPSASFSSTSPRDDPLTLNHDPAHHLPSLHKTIHQVITATIQTYLNIMEKPVTPPDPSQLSPPLLPEVRPNFPAAGTLIVVQGIVDTSDVSQPGGGGSEHSKAMPHRVSSVPPLWEPASRRR
jgi:hypothetical protein